MSVRIDVALVQRGLCASRTQALGLIEQGLVELEVRPGLFERVRKASSTIESFNQIRVKASELTQYVSRGGLKLRGALEHLMLDVKGLRCIDFGQSTGGFTDCLIQNGAKTVVGLEVGHNQLHASLKQHEQVRYFEGINIYKVDSLEVMERIRLEAPNFSPFELAVADLSFIATQKALPMMVGYLQAGCRCVFLIKPQFELGPEHIGKNGIVKAKQPVLDQMFDAVKAKALQCKINEVEIFKCVITGGDGNQEYFLSGLYSP